MTNESATPSRAPTKNITQKLVGPTATFGGGGYAMFLFSPHERDILTARSLKRMDLAHRRTNSLHCRRLLTGPVVEERGRKPQNMQRPASLAFYSPVTAGKDLASAHQISWARG
ncbi:hypothetical protein TWF569_004631 [Orbilia oligospora]|uniref:Uncharacterized protein n=1 Tax=Orbilia oligospora TaxID=2813651 RepID=A0A7C8MZK4_ORBOL|nr:hypothetical protein TWF102_010374 [Orbilia oligospora]KAF3092179.1 hypothetical protein TWF103_011314 [Orbilia oligospora]KAF3092180.1 hypothetical protein TWF103_011314 [Orbilia oligospora]KAF3107855.1 hypothetical protein TWF706_002664 [Orbilia oligospora]KAF3118872.1 hypothetical protein TWF569_004631 [Orbilia oligospora]